MRLTARLWGGVKSAPEPPQEAKTYRVTKLTPRKAFESMLNSNQRQAWEGPWEPYAGLVNHEWRSKYIPVFGNDRAWFLEFYGPGDPPDDTDLRCRLCDPNRRAFCFHATVATPDDDYDKYKLANTSHPYEAAIAFMVAVKANDGWVWENAGR